MTLKPEDRVLWVGTPAASQVSGISSQLTAGVLVVVAPEEDVLAGRAQTAELDNVMWVPEAPDGQVPWMDGFFTVIVAGEASPDIHRVLASGGRLIDQGVFSA